MSLQEIKLILIQTIVNSDSATLLQRVQHMLLPENDPLSIAREPMPKSLDLEILKREQGYDGAAYEHWLHSHDHSAWADEDFDELLQLV